jgi:hypothetical protein
MAGATLRGVVSPLSGRHGERWYLLTTDVFSAPFFDGPGAAPVFRVLDGETATYGWRSAIDVVHERALAVVVGALSVDEARRAPAFAAYLDDKIEEQRDAAAYEGDESWAQESDEVLVLRVCAQIAAGTRDVHAYDEVYCFDDDRWLGDAGRAVAAVLPPWARVQFLDAGGPGSGYSQPYLVLADDRTLFDLKAHLEQPARPRTRHRRD